MQEQQEPFVEQEASPEAAPEDPHKAKPLMYTTSPASDVQSAAEGGISLQKRSELVPRSS